MAKIKQECLPHRHLSKIDCLKVRTACLVYFISTVNGRSKKVEIALEDVGLVVGMQQNLSNLLFFRYLWFAPSKFFKANLIFASKAQ
jgi:hypothetical protein